MGGASNAPLSFLRLESFDILPLGLMGEMNLPSPSSRFGSGVTASLSSVNPLSRGLANIRSSILSSKFESSAVPFVTIVPKVLRAMEPRRILSSAT